MAKKERAGSAAKIVLGGILFALPFFLVAHAASAASLYLSPVIGTYSVGQTFTVNVYVSSPDQAMNAAQGVISFPIDKLEVYALSKTDSIANLWVQDPSFSNQDGTITFGAIVTNPGYTGPQGQIIKITFHARSPGTANIAFSSGSVLANDGKGTNILSSMQNAAVTLTAAVSPPPAPPAITPQVAPAPTATTAPTSAPATPSEIVITSSAPIPPPGIVTTPAPWLPILFIILIFAALLVIIVAAAYLLVRRLRKSRASRELRETVHEKRELRDDLARIEKEMEAGHTRKEIDLSDEGLRRKQELVKKEIEHLEKDIEKDKEEDVG